MHILLIIKFPDILVIDGIPGLRGEKGERGDVGLRGPTGDTGIRGSSGTTGRKGDTGDEGTVHIIFYSLVRCGYVAGVLPIVYILID